MTSYVREASLKLRIAERDAGRADAWRKFSERTLLHNVLEALEAAIAERLGPAAIVRIKHLPLRWRFSPRELESAALHRRLGEELAEGLLEDASAQRTDLPRKAGVARSATRAGEAIRWTRPKPGATIAVFADEVHELAVAIAERSEGREPAFYVAAIPTIEAAWQRVGELAVLPAVMIWLDAAGATERAIATAPPAVKTQFARPAAHVSVPARPSATLPRAVRVDPDARSAPPAPAVVATPSATHTDTAPAIVTPAIDVARATPADAAALAPPPIEPTMDPGQLTSVATRAGGAFYLLASVLELELGEHLWCTGVAEGPHVAAALARLAPALAEDPAFAVIAGGEELVALAAWAADEVIAKTRDSLGRWLTRRGVATTSGALAAWLEGDVHDVAAGAFAAMVCERMGIAWSRDPARALLRRGGRIIATEDELTVELPLSSVDLDVRRAGLDRDPGWIPWLRKTARIAHVPGDGDAY